MKRLVVFFAVTLSLLFSPVEVAQATDNNIDAAVCSNDGSGSTITITEPISDSVVNQPVTTFRGTLHNATQIEIEIDGDYVSTVSIGSDQANFATDVTLTKGTHTVKFIANDVCQNSNGSDTVVVTFAPETDVSNGGLTPTDVEGGVSIGSGAATESTGPFQLEQLPVIGPVYKALVDVGGLIGLDATFEAGASSVVVGGVRVTLTVMALTLLIVPNIFFPLAAQYAPPKIAKLVAAEILRDRHYLDRIFRGFGGMLLLLIFFS